MTERASSDIGMEIGPGDIARASQEPYAELFDLHPSGCFIVDRNNLIMDTNGAGAALLAGLAVGFYASADDVAAARRVERTFEPRMPAATRERLRATWSEAVRRSLHWAGR